MMSLLSPSSALGTINVTNQQNLRRKQFNRDLHIAYDFLNLFRAMCTENREATIIAFSQAIKECLGPGGPEA